MGSSCILLPSYYVFLIALHYLLLIVIEIAPDLAISLTKSLLDPG